MTGRKQRPETTETGHVAPRNCRSDERIADGRQGDGQNLRGPPALQRPTHLRKPSIPGVVAAAESGQLCQTGTRQATGAEPPEKPPRGHKRPCAEKRFGATCGACPEEGREGR